MRYLRRISKRIEALKEQFPAIILTGARQTGKTTLLKELFSDYSYITLDLPSDAALAENDPEAFLANNPAPLVIDEAQYAPALFRHLKLAIDQNREEKGRYILAGSQKFNLMKEISDSLAGRCAWLELEGLSISEIIDVDQFQSHQLDSIIKLMTRGSLPELWNSPHVDEKEYYRSYLATYLERDVRQILNISSLRDFERFIRVCAARATQLLNKTDIAKDVGVSLNTVNQWLSVLEASNQITLLEPYFQNFGKRVVKTPKIYFNEIGMLCFLLNINSQNLLNSPFAGHLWENFLFCEFNKNIKNRHPEANLWFYRDNRANEIDFILEKDNQLNFYEAKWSQNIDSKVIKSFKDAYSLFSQDKLKHIKVGKPFILCRTPSRSIKDGIEIINLTEFE